MISLRRRQVVIAGLGTFIAPAALYAAHFDGSATPLDASEQRLVLSGCVHGLDGKPLASAMVTVGKDEVATDADGRFVVVTMIRRTDRPLCRVTYDGHAAAGFPSSQRRDPDGTLRATLGLTLA